jgi:mono/diheme cytochrome c family protein
MKGSAAKLLRFCAPILALSSVYWTGTSIAAPEPTESQVLGLALFNQSCRVCHTKPQLTSAVYGPVLSKDSAGGREDVMRQVIRDGTPRMPGFRYHFAPQQIDAIVEYLKTVPVQTP